MTDKVKSYQVTMKIEELIFIDEATNVEDAETQALEEFKFSCNSARWVHNNTEMDTEEED